MQKQAPMGVAVYGLMRTGTTLVSDLLTLRGESFVVAEPDLFVTWHPQTIARVQRAMNGFGLNLGIGPELPRQEDYQSYLNFFNKEVVPKLAQLKLWGIKHVSFQNWAKIFDVYRPERLVLCVRDIRDVVLSQIEFVSRNGLAFPGGRYMRDEAWVMTRFCYDVFHLIEMAKREHLLLRYEDFVSNDQLREQLREFVSLPRLSEERVNLEAEPDANRLWEANKHGGRISTSSIGRFRLEPPGPARAVTERCWRLLWRYCDTFGYEAPGAEQRLDLHPFAAPRSGGMGPVENWQVNQWNWLGPMIIEPAYARRRARLRVAKAVPPRSVVLDLACCIPALKYLLPEGCRYIGSDMTKRFEGCLVADYHKGELPDATGATLVSAIGLLEYLSDVSGFLARLRSYDLPAIITYHAADDTAGLDRADLGWHSHLSRLDFLGACRAANFDVASEWTFDGHQSLFRLRPLQTSK